MAPPSNFVECGLGVSVFGGDRRWANALRGIWGVKLSMLAAWGFPRVGSRPGAAGSVSWVGMSVFGTMGCKES